MLNYMLKRKKEIDEIRRQHRARFLSCLKHVQLKVHEIYYDLTKAGNLPGGKVVIHAEYEEIV